MSELVSYLTFIEQVGRNRHGSKMCRYKCQCGNEIVTLEASVKTFLTKSCGCLKIKHSLTKHPLYVVYNNMKARCYNPKATAYKNYGGRGIVICEEWKNNFKSFYDWAVKQEWESHLEIDRVDNDKGYGPDNCRIVSSKQNSLNRRSNRWFMIGGERLNLIEIAKRFNVSKQTLHNRLKKTNNILECINYQSVVKVNYSFGYIN